MSEPRSFGLFLLLAPAALWLGLLVILPHVEIAILSVSERIAPRVYAFGLANYREFFVEPLYWLTFARTAVMSIMVTALTLLLAFPVALYIARAARGRARLSCSGGLRDPAPATRCAGHSCVPGHS